MITIEEASTLMGRPLVGQDGRRVGDVQSVFLDEETGQPEWATVTTGSRGARERFVPLAEAQVGGDGLRVPYTEDRITGAPSVDAGDALSQAEEEQLYAYYGMGYSERASDSGLPAAGAATASGTAAPAPSRVGGGEPLPVVETRSEERLRVGTRQVETGRARLRKVVVTEHQRAQVQVAHEEVRVTREPITDANTAAAYAGPEITEAVHEVALHAERPVVEKEVVPVERIRLGTQTVVEEQAVAADVRKEELELIDPQGRRTDVDSDPTA